MQSIGISPTAFCMSFLASPVALPLLVPGLSDLVAAVAQGWSGAQRSDGLVDQPDEMQTAHRRNASADHSVSNSEWEMDNELNRLLLAFVPFVRTQSMSGNDFKNFWRSASVLSVDGRPASSKIEGKNSRRSGSDGDIFPANISAVSLILLDHAAFCQGP